MQLLKLPRKIIHETHDQVELMAQMLMEFETLDAEDVRKIINKEWSLEEKRDKLKKAEELHKKLAVVPPPPPEDDSAGTSKKASNTPKFASDATG